MHTTHFSNRLSCMHPIVMHALWHVCPSATHNPPTTTTTRAPPAMPTSPPPCRPHLWTEWLTHASENITLPQTSFATGNYIYTLIHRNSAKETTKGNSPHRCIKSRVRHTKIKRFLILIAIFRSMRLFYSLNTACVCCRRYVAKIFS